MTELYQEPGSSWWPLCWAPVFAGAGAAVEALTGPAHPVTWLLIGLGLLVASTAWVTARRRLLAVRLTSEVLRQGREELSVHRIAEVQDVGASMGARVLGGGWTVPKRFTGVPLRLTDGSTVLAWAKHPDALRAALTGTTHTETTQTADKLTIDEHRRA